MDKQSFVYFFCMDLSIDPVAPRVFDATVEALTLETSHLIVDGYPVLVYETETSIKYYVRTQTIICMAYDLYIPVINRLFSDCRLAVMINWHGGGNAPDKVLCMHTIGDVESGTFGSSEPQLSSRLIQLLEESRKAVNLDDFTVTTEATHWSGVMYGGETSWINQVSVPFLDLEIGSSEESYDNQLAAQTIARALSKLEPWEGKHPVLIYCGGIHFEETITRGVLHPTHPVALTHILPSRWMENDQYSGEEGYANLNACVASIQDTVTGFVIHEKLNRAQRDLVVEYAEKNDMIVLKRKALKNLEVLDL